MARRLNAVVFPGQGAQYRGMGRDLFDEFSEFTDRADQVLGYSIKALCLQDEGRQLSNTKYTQPALYVVNLLHYLKYQREGGAEPDFFAGHSLGEYCALQAAGAFDFETGLRLVQHRGTLMSQAVGGGMAAILNLPIAALNTAREQLHGADIEVANFNSPAQTVVAGPVAAISALQPLVEKLGGLFVPLNVTAAFHSRYMQHAMEEFGAVLDAFSFAEPRIPVLSNIHARPYLPGELKQNLRDQICHPVRWTESIWYLLSRGEVTIRELGPRDVLTKLVEQIVGGAPPSRGSASTGLASTG